MQLNYKTFGQGFPVIILHGLLGSLDNWQSIARKLASANFMVFTIDQRNHGKSPHSDEFSYEILSNDLNDFFEQQKLEQAHVIGHSMGGKTAMLFALQHPEKVKKLIVVDIAPSEYADGQSGVFQALFAADAGHATSREQVQKVLSEKLNNDTATVGLLMKGLDRDEQVKNFVWKFNLDSLSKNFDKISEAINGDKPFTGPALFVKSSRSNYINAGNYPDIARLFPDNQLIEIPNTGHWVHANAPDEFIRVVEKFLSS